MIQVDPAHFSNVITTVQRTGSLAGGAVRGLPNGAVIEGLKGISSFASDISEAQKEFQLGRVRSALERVKQLEMQFNGIVGRWDSSVGSIISATKQGRQKLSLSKLNEVTSARTKMQQLTGSASKAFRDLVTALDHTVSREGSESADAQGEPATSASTQQTDVAADSKEAPATSQLTVDSEDETPDSSALGSFATNYRWGPKLQIRRGADRTARIVPKLEKDRFYFVAGLDPPRVIRVRELQPKSVLVFDTLRSGEAMIPANELSGLIKQGVWILV